MENSPDIEVKTTDGDLEASSEEDNKLKDVIRAISDFTCSGKDQLSFKKGDELKVVQKTTETWWWAELDGCHGYVPANHFKAENQQMWQDDEYFGNYGNLRLHHEMLSDRARTLAYMNAVILNSDFLKDKVILDVGCGSGILSMMCAKHADPRKIYAIEASEMAEHTKKVVRHNGMSEKIEVLFGFAESVEIPEKVDLIISEWMGTMLVFEMMIESVIQMRDRYLQDDGVMWPSTASIFLVPCSAHAQYHDKVEFWDNQFGFDFSCLKSVAVEDFLQKPFHDYVLPKEDCLSQEVRLCKLDMKTVTVQYLEEIICDFEFCITKDGTMHGFCAWFEVAFDPVNPDGEEIVLNTGPFHELTHWKQDLFMLDEPISVHAGDSIEGTVTLSRNPQYRRHIRTDYQFTVISGNNVVSELKKRFYIWR